jgi:tetratricopeptide (TPR) repeat protein
MKIGSILVSLVLVFLVGCVSNPINRATSDNYAETCAVAEEQGNLPVAEEACYRALINTDWGSLGDDLKSEKLYNLARIKRRLSKFSEAESLLQQSLTIEKAKSPTPEIKIGRRLVELSVNLAAQDRWDEGSESLERVIEISDQYVGQEKEFIILVLNKYGEHFKSTGNVDKGNAYISKANGL